MYTYLMAVPADSENYISHHGIKGQKWGIRRFQNPDGTRTPLGRKRERENRSDEEKAVSKKRRLKVAGAAAAGLAAGGAGYGINKFSKKVDKNKLFEQSIRGGKDKPNVSPAEKMAKETGNIGTEAGKIVKTVDKVKAVKNGREVKELSDQELKKRVDRLNLEKQYENLLEEDYKRGHVTADDILSTVGSVVAIGGSLATMISVAQSIKKGTVEK